MFSFISPHFSPVHALAGGAVLGAAVMFKTSMLGAVLGVSCATKRFISARPSTKSLSFPCGMLLAGIFMSIFYGGLEPLASVKTGGSGLLARLLFGGVMVGFGTSLGEGCTSGHGLTGLARLSPRSWVAVPLFMGFGVAAGTLCATSAALPPRPSVEAEQPAWEMALAAAMLLLVSLLVPLALAIFVPSIKDKLAQAPPSAEPMIEVVSGIVFGCGLVISGMTKPSKVAGFLDLSSGAWDPSLAFVMCSALLFTFPFFQYLERMHVDQAVLGQPVALPAKTRSIDYKLVAGAIIFGVGWGVCGGCPGPIWVMMAGIPSVEVACLWFGFVAGTGLALIVTRGLQVPEPLDQTPVVPADLETNVQVVPVAPATNATIAREANLS